MQPSTEQLHNIENKIERFTYETGEKIGSFASTLTSTTLDYKDSTENFIEEHPLKALAIAAGAGLIIGCALTFLFRKKD